MDTQVLGKLKQFKLVLDVFRDSGVPAAGDDEGAGEAGEGEGLNGSGDVFFALITVEGSDDQIGRDT